MKLYRDCSSTPLIYGRVETMEIINYPNFGDVKKVSMGRVSVTDDSPVCNAGGPKISCATATLPNLGTVSNTFIQQIRLSYRYTLSGIPPPRDGYLHINHLL